MWLLQPLALPPHELQHPGSAFKQLSTARNQGLIGDWLYSDEWKGLLKKGELACHMVLNRWGFDSTSSRQWEKN